MEDEKSLPCQVWGLMVQARSVVLRSPEDRISVGIVRASFPRGREDLGEALFPLPVLGAQRRGLSFPIVNSSWVGTPYPRTIRPYF